jgi:hypothetical protein
VDAERCGSATLDSELLRELRDEQGSPEWRAWVADAAKRRGLT